MPNNKMERFTKRARQVLLLAQEYAERLQHNAIDTQHLLVALLQEEGGVAGRALRDLGIERPRLEALIEELSPPSFTAKKIPPELSSGSKRMIELAVDEARRMGHHFIGTEHLLLGLARIDEGAAIDILKRLGVSPEEIRRQTQRVLQENPVPPTAHIPPSKPPSADADSAYSVMQLFITQILEMVANKTATMEQAIKLFRALSPQLKLSIIEQSELINQLFHMERLQHDQVRFRVTDPSGVEAPVENTMSLIRLLKEIDSFLHIIINQPDTPLVYTQDGFRFELWVEKGKG